MTNACLACGFLVHGDDGCEPQPLGDLIPLPCVVCGRPAIYSSGLDRYIHCDSRRDNAPCWNACVRGQTDPEIHRANDVILALPRARRLRAAEEAKP